MSDLVCSITVLASFFAACASPPPLATGYVEGEFVLIAPVATARIEEMAVRRGDRVAQGQTLARMETRDAEIAVAEAVAALAQAESQLSNLKEGMREAEIRVIEASLASAQAQEREAEREANRQIDLFDRGITPQSQVDDALTRLDVARAQVAEIQANLSVARLPARQHQIEAAGAAVSQASARRDSASWQLEQRTLTAPAEGAVFEILRRPGEMAGPQAPVLSVLPDGAVLLRLYVPEASIAGIAPGTRLAVDCDGCAPDESATVTYVSDAPEFTPPVIYSLENRQKLVYLVEARPSDDSFALKPGQIVDVRLDETK
ncbi:HlyD family secretion protein [Ostreiculturibacter nitratireducens]|uniref:HlyD family secretion protein n=1 Tax=Ostreiculturibacter nitratireducens TaxID=3075226 RepID=UPI0031B63151